MTGERVIEVWHEEGDVVEGLPVQREGKLKAYVTIIYGCNEFCTYCIVPYVRGKERSRRPEQILAECRAPWVSRATKRSCSSGKMSTPTATTFLDGGKLCPAPRTRSTRSPGSSASGLRRPIRSTSPTMSIEVMARAEKVCEHVHLPAQAGSDRTLRRMGRRYTREQYLRLVEKMRAAIPDLAITTDLIVGFPGETDEDFMETIRLVEEVEFDGAFMFIYSPRIGTPATRLKEQVPEDVKRDRIYHLIEVQNRISRKKNEEWVGRTVEVLVEGASHKDPSNSRGVLAKTSWSFLREAKSSSARPSMSAW